MLRNSDQRNRAQFRLTAMHRLGIVLFAVGVGWTQPSRPAYEAASIKVNTGGTNGSSSNGTRGQVVFNNQTLHRLVERAYGLKPFEVFGPDWIGDVRFDITAKYPAEMKNEDRPAMLRTLLEDRFRLAVHRETRELPGYALVAVKSGFKLKPVESNDNGGTDSMTDHNVVTLTGKSSSMGELADWVARRLSVEVVDKTGTPGVYDYKVSYPMDERTSNAKDPDALMALVSDALRPLGLRLQAQKVPVEVVVVDHAERVPTEN
jgi:uncharacterized protein (TIGR03435 family)